VAESPLQGAPALSQSNPDANTVTSPADLNAALQQPNHGHRGTADAQTDQYALMQAMIGEQRFGHAPSGADLPARPQRPRQAPTKNSNGDGPFLGRDDDATVTSGTLASSEHGTGGILSAGASATSGQYGAGIVDGVAKLGGSGARRRDFQSCDVRPRNRRCRRQRSGYWRVGSDGNGTSTSCGGAATAMSRSGR
jgi:hypothetical protein